MTTRFNIAAFLRLRQKPSEYVRLRALADFSLAAPYALDPEELSDALELLERFGWDAKKAARHIGNKTALDFDAAIHEKGDDPFGIDGEDPAPGPVG